MSYILINKFSEHGFHKQEITLQNLINFLFLEDDILHVNNVILLYLLIGMRLIEEI